MSTTQFALMTAAEAGRFMAKAPAQAARVRLAELVGTRQVIDLGCGKGEQLEELWLPEQYYGVDASPELIKISRERHPGFRFDALPIQSVKGRWECGIIKAVLEHLPLVEAIEAFEHAATITEVLYVAWATEPRNTSAVRAYQGELDTLLHTYRHPFKAFRWVRQREVCGDHVIWTVM